MAYSNSSPAAYAAGLLLIVIDHEKAGCPMDSLLLFASIEPYLAALAALMDSISSGTTLNRSPVMP